MMRKLVPFKKDITFDSNIDEINSISLEYEVTEKKESLIAGKFFVTGDYRMAPGSVNLDSFEYELPFNINIDKKYYIDEADVDINDFYYEVINNKILSVNIELSVDNVEEREEALVMDRCVEVEDDVVLKEDKVEEINEVSEVNEVIDTKDIVERNEPVKSLFDNLDNNETYTTYKIHIMTENDTMESIIMDYGVTKEKLEDYNNLSDIKIGDKLIVPSNEN